MNNVVDFPYTRDEKLRQAMRLFSKGTADLALVEFKKLIDEGCDEAYSFVGNLYAVGGNNVARDYEKARFYYEQSIERVGSVAAYIGLIRIYYYGLGVERDCGKALRYCQVLVEKENHPQANFYIGKMHMDGCGVERDVEKSKDFFRRSWDRGYVFGLTYLGFAEQQTGHYIRGWIYRIKAGVLAYSIGRKNSKDARIREP